MSIENKANKPINPAKRYILRLLALAKKDRDIGNRAPDLSIWDAAATKGLSQDKAVATFLDGYAERPALGKRTYEIQTNKLGEKVRKYLPAFETITYQAFHDKIKALAMAWRTHPHCQVHRDEFVCIMGFADLDLAVIDVACSYAKAITVPLTSSTAGADLGEIFTNIEPVVLASTITDLMLSVEHAIQQKTVKSVLVFNYDGRIDAEKAIVEKAKARLKEANAAIHLVLFDDLIAYGKQQSFSFLPPAENEQEKLAMIIHSSGSTGKPKGACISNKAMINSWKGKRLVLPRVSVIMAPFNHMMGRTEMYATLSVGGTAYFTLQPDMSTLFEDIRLVRPTALLFYPRIFELIYQHFQNEVTRQVRLTKGNRTIIEAEVKAKMGKSYLGDRLLYGVVGSAPTSAKVKQFIIECFDILLIEGYGNTEAGSGSLTIQDRINRDIVLDYKLVDVPELGYFTTDKPYPRGEFCVKTKFGIKEYYKQPEATAGLMDADGYQLTGDIVEERANERIVIIDRRKDVLKLSQGEYVAVGPLGKVFESGSALVHQIYVYGNSHRSYLLAVIVPEMEVAHKLLGEKFTTNQLKNLIRQELQKVGLAEDLKSFEIPRDFIIEHEKFSQKNDLLSSVRKYLRPALKRKYSADLEALYEAHDQAKDAKIEALKDPNSTLSTLEKLVVLLESQLGIEGIETVQPYTFNELGGDSLGAALFSMSIEEIFGVSLAADVILSPTGSLQQWANLINQAQNHEQQPTTFSTIHGKGATTVFAKDLELDQFLESDLLVNANDLPFADSLPSTVLLTGANGFLGHILCLGWMKKLSQNDGKLICLVRAKDNIVAHERLAKEFKGVDKELETEFHELAKNHLEVLAGDISKPLLGLGEDDFNRLATEVDRICHPAAFVNHRLAYQHLFGPNVVGTAEIIRLAISDKRKPVDFISSLAVGQLLDISKMNNEASPLLEQVQLSKHYAAGYATSKWAAEHLLQKASKAYNLPINTFRCDMILAHQTYKGQINISDMFTRLLYSIITTGLAPASFYIPNVDGSKAKGHYDGLPVDVIAKTIIGISDCKYSGYHTFNTENYHHNDGISLDEFVDWIETAGYSIHRIANHGDWVKRIKDKLTTLPEEQRQQSVLDLMPAFSRPYPTHLKTADCDNFKKLVHQLNNRNDVSSLSEAFIHKCLADIELRNK